VIHISLMTNEGDVPTLFNLNDLYMLCHLQPNTLTVYDIVDHRYEDEIIWLYSAELKNVFLCTATISGMLC